MSVFFEPLPLKLLVIAENDGLNFWSSPVLCEIVLSFRELFFQSIAASCTTVLKHTLILKFAHIFYLRIFFHVQRFIE